MFVGLFLLCISFYFPLFCLFVYRCLLTVLCRRSVYAYGHTICNGSSGLLQ